jgi:hypothetical protein
VLSEVPGRLELMISVYCAKVICGAIKNKKK